MGMPDHLTCLLRNLYAGQEATVRTENQLLSPAFLSDNRLSVENSLKKTLCTVKLFLVFETLFLK